MDSNSVMEKWKSLVDVTTQYLLFLLLLIAGIDAYLLLMFGSASGVQTTVLFDNFIVPNFDYGVRTWLVFAISAAIVRAAVKRYENLTYVVGVFLLLTTCAWTILISYPILKWYACPILIQSIFVGVLTVWQFIFMLKFLDYKRRLDIVVLPGVPLDMLEECKKNPGMVDRIMREARGVDRAAPQTKLRLPSSVEAAAKDGKQGDGKPKAYIILHCDPNVGDIISEFKGFYGDQNGIQNYPIPASYISQQCDDQDEVQQNDPESEYYHPSKEAPPPYSQVGG